jgi:hypothetical protein
MFTRESESSTQVMGKLRTVKPAYSARTSSSVSKNQSWFLTSGSSRRTVSMRTPLNPHCASWKLRVRSTQRIRAL